MEIFLYMKIYSYYSKDSILWLIFQGYKKLLVFYMISTLYIKVWIIKYGFNT